jgi:hypothetical protein
VRNTCLVQPKKPLLNQWHKPSPPISVFKFPVGLCDELEQIIRSSLWGYEEVRKKLHWISSERWLTPSAKAYLASKISVSLIKNFLWNKHGDLSSSHWARLLKAIYYLSGDLIDTTFIKNTSTFAGKVVEPME